AGGSDGEAGKSNDIFLWDTATGKPRMVLKGHLTPVEKLAFSADGKLLLSASHATEPYDKTKAIKGSVRVWALPGVRLVQEITPGGFRHVFPPDGKTVAFSDAATIYMTKVTLWDVDADRPIAALPLSLCDYRFAPDGRSLITGSRTDMLRLWDATT